MSTPPVMPGAEPVDLRGGPVGVLLSHGFTGTTQSIRGWAEHLHAAGLTVLAPRLPGHGTSLEDANTTGFADWFGEVERGLDDLLERCHTVFAMGLSMGGTLVLRLAQHRPEDVAGVVVVNASLGTERKDAKLLPVLSKVLPTWKGIADDIKKPGAHELAYPKIPLKAALSLQQHWPVVQRDLHKITAPVLHFRSAVDHAVDAISGRLLLAGVPHAEERVLENSYHVATLDNDAERIFEESVEFVRTHAPASAG